MNAEIIYWWLLNPSKYQRYRSLLKAFYTKEEAYKRVARER